MPTWLTAVLSFLDPVLSKVLPDQQKRDEFKQQLALAALAQEGREFEANMSLVQGQIETNKIEAASPDFFKSGWRPAFGWICVTAFAYHYLGWPFWAWIAAANNWPAPPNLDVSEVVALSVPLLGVGVYRTVEKVRGVS